MSYLQNVVLLVRHRRFVRLKVVILYYVRFVGQFPKPLVGNTFLRNETSKVWVLTLDSKVVSTDVHTPYFRTDTALLCEYVRKTF